MTTIFYVKRDWGFEHKTSAGQQFGASVGREIEWVIGRALTKTEARILRKHGVLRIEVA